MKILYLFTFCFLSFFYTTAQSEIDPCRDVLLYAGNNTSIEVKNAYLAKSIYDRYCRGTSTNVSSSFGLDLPIKLGKLGLSGGSISEKLDNLCKTYNSRFSEQVTTFSFQRNASEAAIDAWIKCQELNKSGVLINPTVANEQLLINVKQSGSDLVIIQGLRTTGFEKCECTIEGESKNVDENFTHTINNSNQIQIVCQRSIIEDENGRYFEPASLTLGTNKGPFALTLIDDIYPNLATIREINKRIDELTKSSVNADENYLRIGNLQICWGSKVIDPMSAAPYHVATFDFIFPRPFVGTPKISNSIDANGAGWHYSVYQNRLSSSKYSGTVVEGHSQRIPNVNSLPVRFDYIAIGRWK